MCVSLGTQESYSQGIISWLDKTKAGGKKRYVIRIWLEAGAIAPWWRLCTALAVDLSLVHSTQWEAAHSHMCLQFPGIQCLWLPWALRSTYPLTHMGNEIGKINLMKKCFSHAVCHSSYLSTGRDGRCQNEILDHRDRVETRKKVK